MFYAYMFVCVVCIKKPKRLEADNKYESMCITEKYQFLGNGMKEQH